MLFLSMLLEEDGESNGKRNRKVYMQDWISRREERGIHHQLIDMDKHVDYLEQF